MSAFVRSLNALPGSCVTLIRLYLCVRHLCAVLCVPLTAQWSASMVMTLLGCMVVTVSPTTQLRSGVLLTPTVLEQGMPFTVVLNDLLGTLYPLTLVVMTARLG